MRRLSLAFLLVLCGWLLGWYSHRYWQQEPLPSAAAPAMGVQPAVTAAQDPGPSPAISQRLAAGDPAVAVEHYERLLQLGDERGAAHARQRLLEHARALIDRRQFVQAEALLQRMLLAAWRDVEVRGLLAEVSIGQDQSGVAIERLYGALGHAWDAASRAQLTARIRSLVGATAGALIERGDTPGLLALYQQLVQLEPGHAPYFIGLARAQLALGDTASARQSLQLVAQDPEHGAQAASLLARLQPDTEANGEPQAPAAGLAEVAGIPLQRRGTHFLVEAQPDRGGRLELLIDTGATMTIITPDALDHHGIRYRDTGRQAVFNTANGRVQAPVYRIASLAVGDWEVRELEVGVLELGGRSRMDGLLGMNFLQHFRFFIDQNRAELRLSLREP